jgi:hypothetical protein
MTNQDTCQNRTCVMIRHGQWSQRTCHRSRDFICAAMELEYTEKNIPQRQEIISHLSKLNFNFDRVKAVQSSPHGWKKGYNLLSGGGVGELRFAFPPSLTEVTGWVRSEMTANLYYETSCTIFEANWTLQSFRCVCEGTPLSLLFYCAFLIVRTQAAGIEARRSAIMQTCVRPAGSSRRHWTAFH